MQDMRIADFLRHDVQTYGVPGAPDIDRILQACVEAANYIDKLEYRIAQVERERDASVNDHAVFFSSPEVCKHYKYCQSVGEDPCHGCLGPTGCMDWEWRGVCEENTKEEEK